MVNVPIWVTKMVIPTIAAIDVGTDAIRMVVGSVNPDRRIDVLENVREPVRRGQDVFTRGSVSEDTTEGVIDAFQKFRRLIDKYGVEHVKAVATSATREAQNSDTFVDRVAQATGIEIVAIGAEEEARLVHLAVTEHHKHSYYLLNATPLISLSTSQKAIVTDVARYHRNSSPSLQHEAYKVLPAKEGVIVSNWPPCCAWPTPSILRPAVKSPTSRWCRIVHPT